MRWFLPICLGVGLTVATALAFAENPAAEAGEVHMLIKGNIDCDYDSGGPNDMLSHLQALAGVEGVPAYCVKVGEWPSGCPKPNPGPTECDVPPWYYSGPTLPAGEVPLDILDINCDGAIDARDSLYLLASELEIAEKLPPECSRLGTETPL